ncbi:uncharacterized protein EV422DRAFT_523552 [Fimicolochytrium jonesii]|uniref:uncharacterized protein n=1 Tax=Fimicolochytrium jonesii TaxID=1396493 RepID=UPI0022FEB1F9|nr:uncharacterized protein EV422DRAFT_523552 [Fimicolochytrium jonesii]KAI8823148.1 hypothetical protein EV422DRAFT_523552 [Fimicolochytrium jonesii]
MVDFDWYISPAERFSAETQFAKYSQDEDEVACTYPRGISGCLEGGLALGRLWDFSEFKKSCGFVEKHIVEIHIKRLTAYLSTPCTAVSQLGPLFQLCESCFFFFCLRTPAPCACSQPGLADRGWTYVACRVSPLFFVLLSSIQYTLLHTSLDRLPALWHPPPAHMRMDDMSGLALPAATEHVSSSLCLPACHARLPACPLPACLLPPSPHLRTSHRLPAATPPASPSPPHG